MQNGSARSSMQPPQAQRVLCRRTAQKLHVRTETRWDRKSTARVLKEHHGNAERVRALFYATTPGPAGAVSAHRPKNSTSGQKPGGTGSPPRAS